MGSVDEKANGEYLSYKPIEPLVVIRIEREDLGYQICVESWFTVRAIGGKEHVCYSGAAVGQSADKRLVKGKYRHFKGKLYEVVGVAGHSESLGELVVYRAFYDSEEFGSNAL